MSLFRSQAIEAKRRKLWGDVRLAQPPSLTAWTCAISIICMILVSVLIVGRYTRKETVPGFLDSEAGVVDVRPVQGGRVARVFVRQGAEVAAGAPLIEFVSDVGGIEGAPALDVQILETDRQLAAVRARSDALVAGYRGESRRLEDQVLSQERQLALTRQQRQGQENAVDLARRDLERIESLQSQGFAPGSEVDRRRRTLLAEEDALRDLDVGIADATTRISDLRAQIALAPIRQSESASVLAAEESRLDQQRAQLNAARGYVLRAPVAGTVTRVLVREGLTPANNGSLLTIAPKGALLQARLLVPTRAVGFLEVGQEANLQIEAFPFQRFGMVKGYISAIQPMVIRPGDIVYPIEQSEPVYEVEVFITREFIDTYGERRALRPGMVLRADLPIDRRRLWQQLFDPLLAARARGL